MTTRPTLAFATMCKNEEHIIGPVLDAVAPYIDYLLVADNGSTDRTLDIVQAFLDRTGIPGEIRRDPWFGFDQNKNLMMGYVFDKTDYVLHLDADDILTGDFGFNEQDRGFDAYLMTLRRSTITWKATVIYNNRLRWKFCGTAHTIIKCLDRPNHTVGDLSDRGYVIADGVGSRAFDPKKFLYDAHRLEKQFWDTLVDDPDGLNYRSVFYCAQSYMDYGTANGDLTAIRTAIQWNRLFTQLENAWIEEKFEAQMRISRCMMSLGQDLDAIIREMHKAIALFPDRAEPYAYLGTYLNQVSRCDLAYPYLKTALSLPLLAAQRKYNLFVTVTCYGKYLHDELAVACYWTRRKEEGIGLIEAILDDPDFTESQPRIQQNLDFLRAL